MPSVEDIKIQLDNYYKKVIGLKSVSAEDIKNVVKNIDELLMCQDNASLVANELFRFPKSIFVRFFKDLRKTGNETPRVTELFRSLSQSNKWKDGRQLAKLKDSLIELYGKKCNIEGISMLTITFLKRLWFDGKISLNEKINKLSSFIHNAKGYIYEIDYSGSDKSDLELIRDITLRVSGNELTNLEYYPKIKIWFEKYGFDLLDSKKVSDNIEKMTSIPQKQEKAAPKQEIVALPQSKIKVCSSDKTDMQSDENRNHRGNDDQGSLDMSGAISEITQVVKNISDQKCRVILDSISALRNNITEGNRIHQENGELKAKVVRLETEIASKTNELVKTTELLSFVRNELNECHEKLANKTEQIEYLSSMNSRDNEQAVLSLKNNLSAPLRLCYEDWQEFSEAECTDDNYQSLLIILKKIFKTLEKNGIVFEV